MGRNSILQTKPQSRQLFQNSKTATILLILIFILTLITVFFDPLVSGKSLVAPDLALSSVINDQNNFPAFIGGGWMPMELGRPALPLAPTPSRLLLVKLLPPDTYRYAAFMLNTILLFLAATYLLHGKGLLWTSTLIGALAMAFSGQSFTIIAAGHLGKFGMMPCAVFMLGLLDRAITRRSLTYYALAGGVAAMGMFEQPDVMVLFYMLGACYALYKLWQQRPRENKTTVIARHASGILLAGLVFTAVALPTLISTIGFKVSERGKVIEAAGTAPYDYSTCWSMPPEEILEFIAPSFFGVQSGDPVLPYWGRLGQGTAEDSNAVQRLKSLRQHNLYLGVLQVVFALFAVGIGFRRRSHEREPGRHCSETRFWTLALLVTLLLSLGRFTPLYRLFYTLPFISSMRCPIKFMHLIEVSVAMLFAIGMDHFLREIQTPSLVKKHAMTRWRPSSLSVIFVIFSVAAAIGAIIVSSSERNFHNIWQMMPSPFQNGKSLLEECGPALMGNMMSGLIRVSLLAGFGAAIIEISQSLRGRIGLHTWLATIMGCVLALDIYSACIKYVKVCDLSSLSEKNEVLRTVESARSPFRVGLFHNDLTKPGQADQACEILSSAATIHNLDFVRSPYNVGFPYLELAQTLGADGIGIRYWQVTSSDYIFGPLQLVARLGGKPGVRFVAAFDIVPDSKGFYTWRKNPDGKGRYVLLKYDGALPRALVYHDWKSVGTNEWKMPLADPSFDVHKTLVVEGFVPGIPSGGLATPVSTLEYSRNTVRISLTATNDGVLLLNDMHDKGWKVFVNEQPAPLLRCNGVMRGVKVSAGTHSVSMHYISPMALPVRLQVVTMLLMGLLALAMIARWGFSRVIPGSMKPGTPHQLKRGV